MKPTLPPKVQGKVRGQLKTAVKVLKLNQTFEVTQLLNDEIDYILLDC